MLKEKNGEVDAIVTSAEPLSPQQEKTLQANLKSQVFWQPPTTCTVCSRADEDVVVRVIKRQASECHSNLLVFLRAAVPQACCKGGMQKACVFLADPKVSSGTDVSLLPEFSLSTDVDLSPDFWGNTCVTTLCSRAVHRKAR